MTGFLLLVGSLVRRLLREPLVLRSMLFPAVIMSGVLLGLLGTIAVLKGPPVIAVPPGYTNDRLSADLAPYELRLAEFEDPISAVRWGFARAGTDGTKVYTRGSSMESAVVESLLRAERGARWQRDADLSRPVAGGKESQEQGRRFARMMVGIFSLYGVVFGAGMIARDRSDGSLGVEFTLPTSRWLPGAARFVAAFVVLALFLVPSLAVLNALVGVPDFGRMCVLAIASASSSAGIGLISIAQRNSKGGFVGPLSFALIAAFGAFMSGRLVPSLAPLFPIGSMGVDDPTNLSLYGVVPLALSFLVGAVGAWRVSRMDVA